MRPRAVLFDLNGTLSDDEGLFFEIFAELFADLGCPITRDDYFGRLVGLSDKELVDSWLGPEHPDAARILAARIERFRPFAQSGATIGEAARAAVRAAAECVPVGIVSGDYRDEIDALLEGAGLTREVSFVVAIEDVERPKPDPAQYLLALELLGGRIPPDEVVAFEDSPVGIAAAKSADLACVAVAGTLPAERLSSADLVVPAIDAGVVWRVLTRAVV